MLKPVWTGGWGFSSGTLTVVCATSVVGVIATPGAASGPQQNVLLTRRPNRLQRSALAATFGQGSAYGTAIAAREPWTLVAHSTLCGMTDNANRPEPPSAKAITALLREARSLSRRADKLSGTAAAVDDLTTQQLAAEACTSMEQLVHHLMLLERQVQRGEKAAGRRAP